MIATPSVLGELGPTVRAGVIGDPVSHSLSPRIHNAAYRALGLDWTYEAFRVGLDDLARAIGEARRHHMRGLSVTTPLKEAVVAACDTCSDVVVRIGAANTVVFDTAVRADNVDGAGLIDDLLAAWGFRATGKKCAVIGAGASARGVVDALAADGAAEIVVVGRTPWRAEVAAALAEGRGRTGEPESLSDADLVVQAAALARSAGQDDAGVAALAAVLRPGQLVVDLVYGRGVTPFAGAARARGALVRNGIGMLVHQAAHQVALFTGSTAPLDEMWAAVGGRGVAVVDSP